MKKIAVCSALLSVFMFSPQFALADDGLRPCDATIQSGPFCVGVTTSASRRLSDHPPTRWDVRSSVQVSKDVLRDAYEASREAYTKKLQKYAKCTPRQAQEAVAKAHPGLKVENLQLRNIKTSLVYVAFAEDDEDRFVVIVDAGDGKILLDRPVPTRHERVFAEH